MGKDGKTVKVGNQAFAKAVTMWCFQETGVLRVNFPFFVLSFYRTKNKKSVVASNSIPIYIKSPPCGA